MVLAAGRTENALDKEDDGVWQSYEIYKMKLPRTRLVVLSACQTGIEQQYRGEGAVSLARPFIVAGVPLVVASLWPVDSESTEQLMVSFHRHRTQDHLPTAEALRRAQLELLGGEDTRYRQPYYWAAFTAIGGYAEY
jgi:CHAT domain-containing protein